MTSNAGARELIIGLVAPLGTRLDEIVAIIEERLRHLFEYDVRPIRLSEIGAELSGTAAPERPAYEHYRVLMDAGNKARRDADRADVLALGAIAQINKHRPMESEAQVPLSKQAFVLRSIKHPEEVKTLRGVYGPGFFLIGVHASRSTREMYLKRDKAIPAAEVEKLIERDQAEDDVFGQQTRDAFERADAFVSLDAADFKEQLWRLLDLLFGNPALTPTQDEHAMFLAYAASIRSGDLSRQVGALIVSAHHDVLATGANDVPKFGGGLYWPDPFDAPESERRDQRDAAKGFDSNERKRNEIVLKVVRALIPGKKDEPDEQLIAEAKRSLADAGVFDITEYGRPVHAEMDAILSCARVGVSVRGATLFCTTFPCHNCAKHIVAAGIVRVVYIEPYPKSQAYALHSDSIDLDVDGASGERTKVAFEPFVGIGPQRFFDLFSMRLSAGPQKRKSQGVPVRWDRSQTVLRVPMFPTSYIERESLLTAKYSTVVDDIRKQKEKPDE